MSNEIAKLEAAIEIATKRLAELKAAKATQAEKAWPQKGTHISPSGSTVGVRMLGVADSLQTLSISPPNKPR